MTPFILRQRTILPSEAAPSPTQVYDYDRQLWSDVETGVPLVVMLQRVPVSSPFGETTLTRSVEGADQTEMSAFEPSPFGETTMTKTLEGADQSEIAELSASPFGETMITATVEGVDQAEIVGSETEQSLARLP